MSALPLSFLFLDSPLPHYHFLYFSSQHTPRPRPFHSPCLLLPLFPHTPFTLLGQSQTRGYPYAPSPPSFLSFSFPFFVANLQVGVRCDVIMRRLDQRDSSFKCPLVPLKYVCSSGHFFKNQLEYEFSFSRAPKPLFQIQLE